MPQMERYKYYLLKANAFTEQARAYEQHMLAERVNTWDPIIERMAQELHYKELMELHHRTAKGYFSLAEKILEIINEPRKP